jgi:DNA-binding response OmpR family regulator
MTAPIIVFVPDPAYRQLVVDVLADLGLTANVAPTWRAAVARTGREAPALAVVDLDTVNRDADGLRRDLKRACGITVPLIVLSHRADVVERAEAAGAVALRKPVNVGLLIAAIARSLGLTSGQE